MQMILYRSRARNQGVAERAAAIQRNPKIRELFTLDANKSRGEHPRRSLQCSIARGAWLFHVAHENPGTRELKGRRSRGAAVER